VRGQVQQRREYHRIHFIHAQWRGGAEPDQRQLGHILGHGLEPGHGQAGAGQVPPDWAAQGRAHLQVDQ